MAERIVKAKNSFKFPSVDVVEASAGSGKTYALAKRYIKLILDPHIKSEDIPIKSILAVTFTNKASMEMKQRILEFLKRIAFDRFDNKSQLAYKRMDEIIDNYNFFQVQTIDSFIHTLLKGCAFDLDLPFDFKIKQNQHKYLVYSIDCLIDKKQGDQEISDAFDEFLNYYLFAENKESWFSKQNIVELIEILYNYSNVYGGSFRKPEVEVKEIIEKKKNIIGLIGEIQRNAPEGTDKRFMGSIDKFLDKNKDGFAIESISAYFTREEFPLNKGAEPSEKIAKLWIEVHKNLDELCKCESLATFNPYIKIFNLAIAEFRKLANFDDVVFLCELNSRAQRLFSDNEMPVPEIYYRIATRLHHYLVDEFQDTNELQWRNIFPLVEEALSSDGSLFYVGDKKQAIFRFRGGDVSLFDSIPKQKFFAKFNSKRTVLAKNYRSQKEIVKFNNEIFASDNLERFVKEVDDLQKDNFEFSDKDVKKVLNIFEDSKEEPQEEHKYGYVKVEAVKTPTVDENISEKVVHLIKELKQRFNYGDIAILARENKDVKLFTRWLMEEDIPVESERTVNIREQALVKELISFLKFFDSPIDNLFFASFILGDIFQKASGIKEDTIRDFLFKRHQDKNKKQKGPYLYREFRKKFPDVWNNLLDELFKSVGFAPLYEFMVSIFNKFKVMENFPDQQGFFMRLLELIKEKEDDYSGLSSFLEFFEEIEEKELFVNLTSSDSVRIMTIHKSKGLEFPVVIIPSLEMGVGVGSGASVARKPYIVQQSENKNLRLIRLKKKYGLFSDNLKKEYKNEYLKSLIDELNTLYVALTRAMDELYIFIPSRVSGKNNLACSLFPYKIHPHPTSPVKGEGIDSPPPPLRGRTEEGGNWIHERGSKRKYEKKQIDKKEMHSILLPVSNYSDWLGLLKNEFISPLQLLRRDNLLRGNIIHFLLSCIGNLDTENKDESLRIAGEKAKSLFLQEKNLDEYISIVRNLLEDEKFKQFFYIKDGSVYQEKEIVDSYGNRKVIDRLIITSKEVWIVDYKSSRDGFDAQKEQIREYITIVKSIYPEVKIKGFLIYPNNLTMEEV